MNNRNTKTPAKIVLQGDGQAEALGLVLDRIASQHPSFTVKYVSGTADSNTLQNALSGAAMHALQTHDNGAAVRSQRNVRTITFPHVQFSLLWPLTAVNPFDAKRFPYGDSFLISAAKQGVDADEIARIYLSGAWSGNWPSLDKVFQTESVRLSSLDAKNDVKIGSYILKHFKRERLFWTVNSPSNRLLAELAYRVLHLALGQAAVPSREEIAGIVFEMGVVDLLGSYAVPVHPFVARHFNLEWRETDEGAVVFGEHMSYEEYVTALIASASPGREKISR